MNISSLINIENIQSIISLSTNDDNIITLEVNVDDDDSSLKNSELDISKNTEFNIGSILKESNVDISELY